MPRCKENVSQKILFTRRGLEARSPPEYQNYGDSRMPTLPIAEWTTALEKMSAALNQALADLDRHWHEWSSITDLPATAAAPMDLLAVMEQRLTLWDHKLGAAAGLAASVEKQLDERESAMERWHELFVRWQELIQNRVVTSSPSPG